MQENTNAFLPRGVCPYTSIADRCFGIWQQLHALIPVVHLHCMHHWSRHAARWEARPMLYAVFEEAEGAVVKVEQHAHTIALLVEACCIVVSALLAVAAEGAVVSADEPAVGAFPSCRRDGRKA